MTRHGWLIAIAVAYLYVFPYFPGIHSANELPRVYLTRAMVEEGTVHIDTGVRTWGSTADVSPSSGHVYSNKAPGSSMLAIPTYAIARLALGDVSLETSMWICRVTASILPALVFLWLLWGFLERFAPDPDIRRLVLVAYALGSMAMCFSMLFYSHQLGAVCGGCAFIFALDVIERRRSARWMAAAGAFAGAALLVDYQAVFSAVPIAVLVIVRIWRWPARETMTVIGCALAGAAVPIAILLVYHDVAFGSPLRTGYDASESFAVFHQQGFLGITTLRSEAFWGSLVKPDNGLFALSPWLLLAIPGTVALVRRGEAAIAITCTKIVIIYVLFVSSINFWRGGWSVGPRYITAMLPFMLPAIAAQLQAWKDRRLVIGVVGGAIVFSIAIYALTMATFPYWPDSLTNPFAEIILRALGDGIVAPNVGSALGIGGIAGIVPFLLLVAGLTGIVVWRAAGTRGLALAAAIGAALVVWYAVLPHSTPARSEHAYEVVRKAMRP